MSHSLDEAIAENNRWEQQKREIDQRWADQVLAAHQPKEVPTSLTEQVKTFMDTHAGAIRASAQELDNKSTNSSSPVCLRRQASHVRLLLDQLNDMPRLYFEQKNNEILILALNDAATQGHTLHSSTYANRLREAINGMKQLTAYYHAPKGPIL